MILYGRGHFDLGTVWLGTDFDSGLNWLWAGLTRGRFDWRIRYTINQIILNQVTLSQSIFKIPFKFCSLAEKKQGTWSGSMLHGAFGIFTVTSWCFTLTCNVAWIKPRCRHDHKVTLVLQLFTSNSQLPPICGHVSLDCSQILHTVINISIILSLFLIFGWKKHYLFKTYAGIFSFNI